MLLIMFQLLVATEQNFRDKTWCWSGFCAWTEPEQKHRQQTFIFSHHTVSSCFIWSLNVFFLLDFLSEAGGAECASSDGPVSVNDLQVYCTLLKMSDNLLLSCCSRPLLSQYSTISLCQVLRERRHLLMTQGQNKTQLIISCWAFHSRCWRSEGISSLTPVLVSLWL